MVGYIKGKIKCMYTQPRLGQRPRFPLACGLPNNNIIYFQYFLITLTTERWSLSASKMAKGTFMTVASLMDLYWVVFSLALNTGRQAFIRNAFSKTILFELSVPQKQIFLLKPQNRLSFHRFTLFIIW